MVRTISVTGNNVIISWPSLSSGFELQENVNLTNANGWSNFSGSVTDDGAMKIVTVPVGAGSRFYRLKNP